MDKIKVDREFLQKLFTIKCERETMDEVLREMRKDLGDDMPEAKAVRAYLRDSSTPTTLTPYQQMIAMDKLLMVSEVNFRTFCDLVRYQLLKENGVVHSVEEFLRLFDPDDLEEDTE